MVFLQTHTRKWRIFVKAVAICLSLVFVQGTLLPPGWASPIVDLPVSTVAVLPSPVFSPAVLKGIKVYPQEPLRLDFILSRGDSVLEGKDLRLEAEKLIRYFLASLTIPEKDLWVNLSPYEENRIAPEALSMTELGQDLLAQDYMLKQITASLINPDQELGRSFWEKVYRKAYEQYGTTQIAVDTFNKVWIVPEKAIIFSREDKTFIIDVKLKVLLEEDYLALQENRGAGTKNSLASEVAREVLIPELEKEVNFGKNFAPLRQVCYSLVLATWFKRNLQQSILHHVYADQNKIEGIDSKDQEAVEEVYSRYLKSFQEGAYHLLRVEQDVYTNKNVPRKYFSGGFGSTEKMTFQPSSGIPSSPRDDHIAFQVKLQSSHGAASPLAASMSFSAEDGTFLKPDLLSWEEIEAILGPGGREALSREKPKTGFLETLKKLMVEFWQDEDVKAAFAKEGVNSTTELIRFLIKNNIGLRDLSLKGLTMAAREVAPPAYRSRVNLQLLTVPEYVFFFAGIKNPALQDYLGAISWEEILPHERIYLILEKMQELGIPCARLDREGMDAYSIALPDQIAAGLTKKMILNTKISFYTIKNIRGAFEADPDLKSYLVSDEFIFTSAASKRNAVLAKLKELGLVLPQQELTEAFSGYLTAKLAEQVLSDPQLIEIQEKMFGAASLSWFKKHQLSFSSIDQMQEACRQILSSADFAALLQTQKKISPADILRVAINNDIFLGTPSLRSFIEMLRTKAKDTFSEDVVSQIRLSRLSISDYVGFMAALEHPTIKHFLQTSFQSIKEPYRMFMILREIQKIGITFLSESIEDFYIELPDVLAETVERRSIRYYMLNMSEVARIKSAVEQKMVLAPLFSEKSFRDLPEAEKIDQMYDALAQREFLSRQERAAHKVKMFLRDILRNLEDGDRSVAKIREDIFGQGIEDFLIRHKPVRNKNDYDLMAAAARAFHDDRDAWAAISAKELDYPTALVRFAAKNNMSLGTGYIQTFANYYRDQYPDDLKESQVFWDISFKDFINLRAYLLLPEVQKFISEDLRQTPPWERLVVLLEKMEEFGLVLEKEYLAIMASALPLMLTPSFSKEEMRVNPFLRPEYYQMKKDFHSLWSFLRQPNLQQLSFEEKIQKVWEQAGKKGLLLGKKSLSRELKYLIAWFLQDFEIDHVDKELKRKREEIFGANVHGWMKRHYERSKSIPWRVEKTAEQFWKDVPFREAISDSTESIHLQVIRYAILRDDDLGTPSLAEFFDAIKKMMPSDVPADLRARFRIATEISANEFIDFYSGLFHSKIQQLLNAPEFQRVPKHIRLVYLWEEMRRQDLPVPPGRFSALLAVLPQKVGKVLTKRDFGTLELNIDSVNAIRRAILGFRDQIQSSDFIHLDIEQKVQRFLALVQGKGLGLGISFGNERLFRFLTKVFLSIPQDGVEKALGTDLIDLAAIQSAARSVNGNGTPEQEHTAELFPEDFRDPLDFNGKGRLILENMMTANNSKGVKKQIARVALAMIEALKQGMGPAPKIVLVYGIWPKEKDFVLYMARIFKAYGFSVEVIARPDKSINIGDFVQQKIQRAGPNCIAGVYVGTNSTEDSSNRILIAQHAQSRTFTESIQLFDEKNQKAHGQAIRVAALQDVIPSKNKAKSSSAVALSAVDLAARTSSQALNPGGVDLNPSHFRIEERKEENVAFQEPFFADSLIANGFIPVVVHVIPSVDVQAFFGLNKI